MSHRQERSPWPTSWPSAATAGRRPRPHPGSSWASQSEPDPPLPSWSPRPSGSRPGRPTSRSSRRAASSGPRRLRWRHPPFRGDPSFTNLQATSVMSEGGMVADVIVAIASSTPYGRRGPARPSTHDVRRAPRDRRALYPGPLGLLRCCTSCSPRRGRVTAEGIEACAEIFEISAAEVSGVATFYTKYRQAQARGNFPTVGACPTNTLCAVMGGDAIFRRLQVGA